MVNVKILEEKKHRLVFEIEGDSHTLAAALTKELWNDEHIKVSGYNVDHPLLGKPKFVVETDGADPKKAVSAALKRLGKLAEKLSDNAAKELK